MRRGTSRQISLLVGVMCLLATATGVAGCVAAPASGSSVVSWTKVWSVNFAGPAGSGVNTRYWKYQTGYGVFGNGEVETMTDSAG